MWWQGLCILSSLLLKWQLEDTYLLNERHNILVLMADVSASLAQWCNACSSSFGRFEIAASRRVNPHPSGLH
jgi:hypothetical protein